MLDKVIEKTKDIETIYFQNHLLANKIIELKHTLEKNLDSMNPNNRFNGFGSAYFVTKIISESEEYNLKKANSTYASIKDSIDMNKFKGLTAESLLSEVDTTMDPIADMLNKEAEV